MVKIVDLNAFRVPDNSMIHDLLEDVAFRVSFKIVSTASIVDKNQTLTPIGYP